MIDLASVMAALRGVSVIRQVGDAASAAAAMAGNLPSGDGVTAYVIPLAESGSRALSDFDPVQSGRQEIAVLLQIRVPGDAAGSAALPQVPAISAAVRRALIGMRPPGALTAISFVDARMEDLQPGVLWWAERFTLTGPV